MCIIHCTDRHQCINRNIVECKEAIITMFGTGSIVLIETLWNVKQETALNVNIRRMRINRNIVECKDDFRRFY